MPNYIHANMSTSEVVKMFGDQVPEFMRDWLEDTINELDILRKEADKEYWLAESREECDRLEVEVEYLQKLLKDNYIDY